MQKSDAVVLRTCQEKKKEGFTWYKRNIQISAVYIENPVVPQVMKIFNCLCFDEIIFDLEVEVGSIPYLVRKS